MRYEHPHALRALLLAALLVVSCGGPAREREAPPEPLPPVLGSRSLAGELHVDADPGAPSRSGEGSTALDLRNWSRVAIGDSEREAVATTEGVRWTSHVELPRDATLRFAIASRGEATSAIVQLGTERGLRELFRRELAKDQPWIEETIRIENATPTAGELILESDAPVVWSELYVSPVEVALRGPNLILVIIDTLRADHTGFMGYAKPTTPNLDRLAQESFVFDEARSASTWTLPSTASMLTGLFPDQHSMG